MRMRLSFDNVILCLIFDILCLNVCTDPPGTAGESELKENAAVFPIRTGFVFFR